MTRGNEFNRRGKRAVPQLLPSSSATPSCPTAASNSSSDVQLVVPLPAQSFVDSIAANSAATDDSAIVRPGNNNAATGRQKLAATAGGAQDRNVPVANVVRIMRRILPANAMISDEAKEFVQECVAEFIGFITSEANQRCKQEERKIITADDVLGAMRSMGFDIYVGLLSSYLYLHRQAENKPLIPRNRSYTSDGAAAHGRCGGGAANSYSALVAAPLMMPPPMVPPPMMPPPIVPLSPAPHHLPLFPTGTDEQAMWEALTAIFAAGGGGGADAGESSSQNDQQPNFDPYTEFK